MNVIEFYNYTLSSGFVSYLKNLTFSIQEGDSVAILGPAGSGKRRLLSIIAQAAWNKKRFFFQDSYQQKGEIYLFQIPCLPKPEHHACDVVSSQIGYVSDKNSWLPISIAQNFQVTQKILGLSEIIPFYDYIESLPISSRNKAQILSFSEFLPSQVEDPFLQQLAVMRELLKKPKLFLIGDVFLRMDPVLIKQTERLILSQQENTTLVWAIDDLYQASRITNKIIFIKDGSLIEYANTDLFFTNPSTGEAESFISGRDDV